MKIVICSRSVCVGGIEVLFTRICNYLGNTGKDISYLDFPTSLLKPLLNKNVAFIPLKENEVIDVDADVLLVATNSWFDLHELVRVKGSCKVLFWMLHPMASVFLIPYFAPLLLTRSSAYYRFFLNIVTPFNYQKTQALIQELSMKKSFILMDGENLKQAEILNSCKILPLYLPIPVDSLSIKNLSRKLPSLVRIYWIGRLVNFKIHILMKLIRDIALSKNIKNIKLFIVGEGKEQGKVEDLIELLDINAVMLGTIAHNELQKELQSNADLAFCMGTAALECAKECIPTILVDASYGAVSSQYKYNWLYETKNFTLGKILDKQSIFKNGITFDEVFLALQKNKELLAQKNYDYVKSNHSIEKVCGDLIKIANESNFYFKDLVKRKIRWPFIYYLKFLYNRS